MSSNMIKAYSIAYDKEKRKVLEMEEREKQIAERLQEILPFRPLMEEGTSSDNAEEAEFIPGIFAEDIGEYVVEQTEQLPVPEIDIEAIKASLREEVTNEIALEYQKQGGEILARAQAQANELLETAKRDAETAKESILKIASSQGYEEGLQRAKAEEERKLAELEEEKLRIQQEYERQVSELEPAFVRILEEMVKKVTGVVYDTHEEVLLYLLECGLGFAPKDTKFDVVLSEEDFEHFSGQFESIQEKFQDKLVLEFRKDAALANGSVHLENENRLIDCGLGRQLEGLLEELSLLE